MERMEHVQQMLFDGMPERGLRQEERWFRDPGEADLHRRIRRLERRLHKRAGQVRRYQMRMELAYLALRGLAVVAAEEVP